MHVNISTAPVSWGVLMKDTPNVPPFGEVLDEIEDAGYIGTELGPYGYLPFDISRLRDELAQRNLELISAFTILNLLELKGDRQVFEEAVTTARVLSALGCDHIVLSDALFVNENRSRRAGRIRPEDCLDTEGWNRVGANVDTFAGMAFEEYGLKCVIHPHVGGYLETPAEIDAVLERTNPELVGLCFDMAHIAYGGGNPVIILDKWRQRTWYLHIKECDQRVLDEVLAREGDYFDGVESGVFPELGCGTVDWLAIRKILDEADYDGWATVEQDILPGSGADPLASARRNRAYLRETLGW